MKLIDMLINAFEITGGWPQGIDAISQEQHGLIRGYVNVNGHIYMYPLYMLQLSYGLAEDYETAIITHDQYEAALAASQKVEWDGNGLPPAGCEFEYLTSSGAWMPAKMKYCGRIFAIVDIKGQESWLRLAGLNVRTVLQEVDMKRDEAIEAIASYALPYKCGADIYDAISAGKIPGVRIE
ncbi:hypothetical protein C9415_10130 [Kluyvera sp. Nf5]|nr:hypothetical protein C9415_10130 [Kluyvera sp. Nf5]